MENMYISLLLKKFLSGITKWMQKYSMTKIRFFEVSNLKFHSSANILIHTLLFIVLILNLEV